MGLVYVASFAILFAVPVIPVQVHEALASLPSSPSIVGIQLAGQ